MHSRLNERLEVLHVIPEDSVTKSTSRSESLAGKQQEPDGSESVPFSFAKLWFQHSGQLLPGERSPTDEMEEEATSQ